MRIRTGPGDQVRRAMIDGQRVELIGAGRPLGPKPCVACGSATAEWGDEPTDNLPAAWVCLAPFCEKVQPR
jgi:hypothetical protein